MGKKAAKSTRKFAKSGELKRTIQARRKHKAVKAKVQARKATRKGRNGEDEDGDEDEDEEGIDVPEIKSKTVDDILNGDLMEEQGDEEDSDDEEDAESLGLMDDDDDDQGKSIL